MQSPHPLTASISRASNIVRTARVLQLEGMFDVPPAERSVVSWDVTLPLHERPWNIGLIVGPSGCGKSTVARELFGDHIVRGFEWHDDRAVIDDFPDAMSIKDVSMLLSSVGFSSPPSWLRPFKVLSTGEQFRVEMARAMAEMPDFCVIDEFTSVIDRTVAQIGSAAIAKTVRKRGSAMVAVTCHYDVEEWLDPDWVFSPVDGKFTWRSLRRRPPIGLEIGRVHHSLWRLFAPHHYLTADLNKAAVCLAAFIDGRPVAFDAWLPFVGRLAYGKARRGHRTVCLPDFQGVGIGNALFERGAAMWRGLGDRVFSGTGHPAEIARRLKSPNWRMTKMPGLSSKGGGRLVNMAKTRASNRILASFEHIGEGLPHDEAEAQLNTWAMREPR